MDTKALLSSLLSSSAVSNIGKVANASTTDVTSVLTQAVPALLQGASQQAQNSSASFSQALQDHAKDDTSNVNSFFKNINLADGAKIVSHLLGSTSSTTNSIAKETGVSSSKVSSILSAAAPMIMSLLGQQTAGTSASGLGNLLSGLGSSANISGLVSGLLGGGNSSSNGSNAAASLLTGLAGSLFKKK